MKSYDNILRSVLICFVALLQYTVYTNSKQLHELKSEYSSQRGDIMRADAMIKTFTEVAPREMEKIARSVSREEIEKLGLILDENKILYKLELDKPKSQPTGNPNGG